MSWFTRSVTSPTDFYIGYLLLKLTPISHKKGTNSKQSENQGEYEQEKELKKLKRTYPHCYFLQVESLFYLDIILQEIVGGYLKIYSLEVPTGTMVVLRLIINNQKVGGGPCSWKSFHLPEIIRIILPLINLWNTQPKDTDHAIFQSLLSSEMAHTMSVEFVSLKINPLLSNSFLFLNIWLYK